MKKRYLLSTLAALIVANTGLTARENNPSAIGVVNFAHCVTESKYGKKEQDTFEKLRQQLTALIEDTDKQIQDLAKKLNNPEFRDNLSPAAEEDLREKRKGLEEEMGRYQNQFYQLMNQANMRLFNTIGQQIVSAAEKVAKNQKLGMVVNKDVIFFSDPKFDITSSVIVQMDKAFDEENGPKEDKSDALMPSKTGP